MCGLQPSIDVEGEAVKVLVCGSRDWDDSHTMEQKLISYLAALKGPTTVIHGAARGADEMAASIAAKHGWKTEAYPADWRGKGKRAGIIRNLQMLDQRPAVVLAFWDGRSTGTKHTVDEARRRG